MGKNQVVVDKAELSALRENTQWNCQEKRTPNLVVKAAKDDKAGFTAVGF